MRRLLDGAGLARTLSKHECSVADRSGARFRRCPYCQREPPHICEAELADGSACGLQFPSRRHLASHNRYNHGVGFRAPNADGTPKEPPPKPDIVPPRLSLTAVRVSDAVIALPRIRIPQDEAACLRIRQDIVTQIGPTFAAMPEPVKTYWRSMVEHFKALPDAIAAQRKIEEEATRQTLRAHGLKL